MNKGKLKSDNFNSSPRLNKIILWTVLFLWAIIGFFIWVPFLIRVIGIYMSAITSSMLLGRSISSQSSQILSYATSLYIEGFKKIKKSFFDKENNNNNIGFSIVHFFHFIWTFSFWFNIYDIFDGKLNFIVDITEWIINIFNYYWSINAFNITWNILWGGAIVIILVIIIAMIYEKRTNK